MPDDVLDGIFRVLLLYLSLVISKGNLSFEVCISFFQHFEHSLVYFCRCRLLLRSELALKQCRPNLVDFHLPCLDDLDVRLMLFVERHLLAVVLPL